MNHVKHESFKLVAVRFFGRDHLAVFIHIRYLLIDNVYRQFLAAYLKKLFNIEQIIEYNSESV